MDIFTAPTAAWQSMMARGPSVVGARSSGSCGGCDDDKPCASCGGPANSTSPAQQALGWGLTQFADRSDLDPFWKAASIGQVVKDAPGRTDSADWRSVESMVNVGQNLVNVSLSGPSAVSSVGRLSAFAMDTIRSAGGGGGGGGVGGKPPSTNTASDTDICCVEKFDYPTPVPKRLGESSGTKDSCGVSHDGELPAMEFYSEAVFWDDGKESQHPPIPGDKNPRHPNEPRDPSPTPNFTGGGGKARPPGAGEPNGGMNPSPQAATGLNCKCRCCRFMQIILKSDFSVNGGKPVPPYDLPAMPFVDALSFPIKGMPMAGPWTPRVRDGSQRRMDGEYASGYGDTDTTYGPTADQYYDKNCPKRQFGYTDDNTSKEDPLLTGCKYKMHDTPFGGLSDKSISKRFPAHSPWTWEWVSLGLILDSCQNNAVRRICEFSWTDQGELNGFKYTGKPKPLTTCKNSLGDLISPDKQPQLYTEVYSRMSGFDEHHPLRIGGGR